MPLEDGVNEGDLRGAANAAPRTDPLRLVEAVVSGDDLPRVVRSAAQAIGAPIAISLPTLGIWACSDDQATGEVLSSVQEFATALIADGTAEPPDSFTAVAPIRLAGDTVGAVVALAPTSSANTDADPSPSSAVLPWLEAAAAAAAVNALMRDSTDEIADSARRTFLQLLQTGSSSAVESVLSSASRLGYDFTRGAVAFCAKATGEQPLTLVRAKEVGVISDLGDGQLTGLIPISSDDFEGTVAYVCQSLREQGATVIASAPRRGSGGVADALREADVLLELALDPATAFDAQQETFRLLLGVMIREPEELVKLEAATIGELVRYDAAHDTDLLATLETFLSHHGSTTDTAEAMELHRHTVGYRLARVQEVSGLSPYESEGRERLSLGLKAHRIILADQRRNQRLGLESAA